MILNKDRIYELIRKTGQRRIPYDDFTSTTIEVNSSIEDSKIMPDYYLSVFNISFEQVVQSRVDEIPYVKENVAKNIFYNLYGDILNKLKTITYEAKTADRKTIVDMLTKLIDDIDK